MGVSRPLSLKFSLLGPKPPISWTNPMKRCQNSWNNSLGQPTWILGMLAWNLVTFECSTILLELGCRGIGISWKFDRFRNPQWKEASSQSAQRKCNQQPKYQLRDCIAFVPKALLELCTTKFRFHGSKSWLGYQKLWQGRNRQFSNHLKLVKFVPFLSMRRFWGFKSLWMILLEWQKLIPLMSWNMKSLIW